MSNFKLLESIDANTLLSTTSSANIETDMSLLAGTVAGTELQVDVQTMPAITGTIDVVDDSSRNVSYRDNVGSTSLLQSRVFHFRRNEITTGYTAFMEKVDDGHAFTVLSIDQQVQLSSSSANDTNSAGTHARTVLVEGRSALGALVSESVNLNGQTGQNTVANFSEIFKIQVENVGDFANMNDGDIYCSFASTPLTAGVPNDDALKFVAMEAGKGEAYRPIRSLLAAANAGTIYLRKLVLSNDSDGTVSLRCDLLKNTVSNAVKPVFQYLFQPGSSNEIDLNYEMRLKDSDLTAHNLVWRILDNGTAAAHEITAIVSYVYNPN